MIRKNIPFTTFIIIPNNYFIQNMMKKLVLSLFLLLGAVVVFAQKGKPLFKAPFGVQAYTFRKQFPKGVAATLDTIKMLGFTELETSGAKGMSATTYRQLCDERGITIPSVGADFTTLAQNPQELVDLAKTFGASFVMCAWIPHNGNEFTLADAQKAVEVFNKAGKFLKENGLTFCYHDHGYEFHSLGKETLLDYIIQHTNPAYVSFEMDVLWTMQGGGNPVQLLNKYKNRWKLMHVKDLKKGATKDFTGHTPAENDVVLGTGSANWSAIIKLANKHGIKHFFIEDESEHEMQNIPQSLNYLKGLKE